MSGDQHADWIEGLLIHSEKDALSLSFVKDRLKETFALNEHDAAIAINSVHTRQKWLGAKYPLVISEFGIKKSACLASQPYTFLTCLANTLNSDWVDQSSGDIPGQLPEFFEEVMCEAMKGLLGDGAKGLRFGWPSKVGRPPEFNEAVRWLAGEMNLNLGNAYRPPTMKDGGVDVVVWRPFADRKPGFPILLGQATIEKNFAYKAADIDVRIWSGWLQMDVDPTVVLAFPWTGVDKDQFAQISARALFLDRVRLASLLPESVAGVIDNPYLATGCELYEYVKRNFKVEE
jgi:hypothetical protein